MTSLAARASGIDLTRACAHIVERLIDGSRHTVRLVACSTRSDYARGSVFDGLTAVSSPAVLERLRGTDVPPRWSTAVAGPVVMHRGVGVSGCFSIDNTELLPPRLAVSSSAWCWSAMIPLVDVSALAGYLPFELPQWEDDQDVHAGPAFYASPDGPSGAELILGLLARTGPSEAVHDPSARCSRSGQGLLDCALLPLPSLARMAVEETVRARAEIIDRCAAVQASVQMPYWWTQAFSEFRRRVRVAAPWPDFGTPLEFRRANRSGPEAVRALAQQAGSLLIAWPALWTRAKERGPA